MLIQLRLFREWCGERTMAYLRMHDKHEENHFSSEKLTEAELLMRKFYAGDRPVVDSYETIELPPVDCYEQARQRVYVLSQMLKPG